MQYIVYVTTEVTLDSLITIKVFYRNQTIQTDKTLFSSVKQMTYKEQH